MEVNGYEMQTTFWDDFTIAEHFGLEAVEDTFKRAFGEWKTDYKYLTELVLVLNWKIWQHHDTNNHELAKLYDKYWREAEWYASENLKGEEYDYYFSVTD